MWSTNDSSMRINRCPRSKKNISIAALIHVNDFVHPTPTNVDVIQKKTFVLVNTLLTVLLFLKAATVLPFCTM
jgi:hypothetical protein